MEEMKNVSSNDILIMKTLFNNILNKQMRTTLDKYMYNTFDSFINNKTQIILAMSQLSKANNNFIDLIMHPIQKGKNKRESNDFSNLLRLETFSIFPNVNTLIINDIDGEYSLSMISLLSLIEFGSLDKVIVKTHPNYTEWINSLWISDSKRLKKEYSLKQYNISMKNKQFVIHKKR